MRKLLMATAAAGLLMLGTGPADAWYRGGGGWAAGGAHWGAAGGGHWAAGGDHYAYGGYHYGGAGYGYHPPAVVNHYYGTGCYNCGGWGGAGAAVAGAAVGVAAGAAIGAAAANSAASSAYAAGYAAGSVYAALPAGCIYTPIGGVTYYQCNGTWFSPAYGANGTYYNVVAAPY